MVPPQPPCKTLTKFVKDVELCTRLELAANEVKMYFPPTRIIECDPLFNAQGRSKQTSRTSIGTILGLRKKSAFLVTDFSRAGARIHDEWVPPLVTVHLDTRSDDNGRVAWNLNTR